MTDLYNALCDRFDDMDEIKDVAEYGCAAGVSGFIYSTELCEFFDKHEEEIEERLQDMGLALNDIVRDPGCWTFQELKEQSVWIAVEDYCNWRVDEADQDD